MSGACFVDDLDLASLGFRLERAPTWRGKTLVGWARAPLPGSDRSAVLGTVPELRPRGLTLTGWLEGASHIDAKGKLDVLLAVCGASETTVRLRIGETDREHLVRFLGADWEPAAGGPMLASRTYRVILVFEADSPFLRSTADTVVGFTTATSMPLGTAPSRPVVRITGPATNPVLTYKHFDGTTLQQLVLTGTIAAADWVEIDMDRHTITKSVSSVLSSALDWRTSGTFFALDPVHGTFRLSQWPTLAVSDGSGQATYRKRWVG